MEKTLKYIHMDNEMSKEKSYDEAIQVEISIILPKLCLKHLETRRHH